MSYSALTRRPGRMAVLSLPLPYEIVIVRESYVSNISSLDVINDKYGAALACGYSFYQKSNFYF